MRRPSQNFAALTIGALPKLLPMNFSVEHIGLPARNPTALKDWYLQTLEGRIVFESGTTPPAYFVRVGGTMLEIYEGDFGLKETSDNKCHGFRHLALRVDSIETAKKDLEGRGVRFTEDVK